MSELEGSDLHRLMELILVNTLSEQVNNCVIQDMLKYPDEVSGSEKVPQDCPYTIIENFL
ncbi:hypothetical protein EYZ11_012447 [Aspergillus tanneri]|uniref:Uncharacterized protein n=1 Tax=Aspergillus tanneri TaxID=1220188 RepID=A0A4S3J2B9_9EURO|nr:hypothetical protein EYZ11_012447 [Aspergillus tanneri]